MRMSVGGNGAVRATRETNTRKGTRRGRGKAGEKGRRDDVTMGEHDGVAQGASRGAGQAKKTKAGGAPNPLVNGQGARGRGAAVRMGKVVRASAHVGVGGEEEKVPWSRHGEGRGAEDDEQDDEEDEV